MILIFSQEYEFSTNKVIDWLNYYNVDYVRVNDTDLVYINKIEIKDGHYNFVITLNNKTIGLEGISCYWYRRGGLNPMYSKKLDERSNDLFKFLNKYTNEEKAKLIETIDLLLRKIPHIGSNLDNNINKLDNLIIANRLGMDVADTIITSSKKELLAFFTKNREVITKPIFEARMIDAGGKRHFGYTSILDEETLKELPEHFPPTLFQEALTKEFELRIFYLDKKLYSTAIFSQLDEQTKVDFRNYNVQRPNRVVPYTVPKEIELKITQFMEKCNYKTGSIDMIVTTCGNFVFLEVNPIGQFEQVSRPGNYHLNKVIAEYLISKN